MSELDHTLVDYLSTLPDSERIAALHRCCGSTRWATELSARIGDELIKSTETLFMISEELWFKMTKDDYLEAFSHHPQIGADPEKLRERFQNTHTWSANEQSGMSKASETTILKLAQGNSNYLEKFGYIFIVCATGKSADEMLALLEARLPNDPVDELQNAAIEQAKITRLRMEKLL